MMTLFLIKIILMFFFLFSFVFCFTFPLEFDSIKAFVVGSLMIVHKLVYDIIIHYSLIVSVLKELEV